MEIVDLKMKQDIEIARARLDDTKQKLAETLTRISKAETDLQESKDQCSRKTKNLKRIESTQFFKLSKLTTDIKSVERLLQARLEEELELRKRNTELAADLKKCQEEAISLDVEFQKMFEDLEEKITSGYTQIQNEKDAEVALEVGMSSLKSEDQVPFVEGYFHEVLKRRQEISNQRQEELKKEIVMLDGALEEMEKEIGIKSEELIKLRNKNEILNRQIATREETEEKS